MKGADTFWWAVWRKFGRSKIGRAALFVVAFFFLIGLYAPFLASSKPLVVVYDGTLFFPLLRYLFYPGFFTKRLDLFYNLLMFIVPLWAVAWSLAKQRRSIVTVLFTALQFGLFTFLLISPTQDPASDPSLNAKRQEKVQSHLQEVKRDPLLAPLTNPADSWGFDLEYTTTYERLNRVLRDRQREEQDRRLQAYASGYQEAEYTEWLREAMRRKRRELQKEGVTLSQDELKALVTKEASKEELERRLAMPTLWEVAKANDRKERELAEKRLREIKAEARQARKKYPELIESYKESGDVQQELRAVKATLLREEKARADLAYLEDRRAWLESEKEKVTFILMPLVRAFHWEDDAGGEQDINQYVKWWELTRVNRKDLVSGLLFGVRISMVVGVTAIALALLIGIPIGALAGYFGGRADMIVMRLIEIWESMPSFFMLLMVVAVTQSKSIFLVVAVIGIFGWTGFSRFIRGEVLKQRHLPYVEACHAMGFRTPRILFGHILPNAIPPLLTLLPFAVMGAITSEAGLSFLGLGEEGSCSWGVLMDEGRTAFPGESYLLWPPAIMLTILLIAIALVGDALRDALDPKS